MVASFRSQLKATNRRDTLLNLLVVLLYNAFIQTTIRGAQVNQDIIKVLYLKDSWSTQYRLNYAAKLYKLRGMSHIYSLTDFQ